MNTRFTLKNFRVFDSNKGGIFQLSPITILTGCNSSGKSSLVKALLLLKNFCIQLKSKEVRNCNLDFGNKAAKLGRYDLACNRDSKKNEAMYFSYTATPKELGEEVLVELWFSQDAEDKLNNGWLNRFVIRKNSNKRVIIDASYERMKSHQNSSITSRVLHINKINFNPILKNFYKRVYTRLLYQDANFSDSISQEDVKLLDRLLKILSQYVSSEEELDRIFENSKRMIGRFDEDYITDYKRELYLEAANQGVLLPLPILAKLKGVKKSELRNFIYSIINSVGSHNRVSLELLDKVLAVFEASEYDDFTKYYKAKEKEGLEYSDIHRNFDMAYVDFATWQKCRDHIDEYCYLLDITRTYLGDRGMYEDYYDPSKFYTIYRELVWLSKLIDENYKDYTSQLQKSIFDTFEEHQIFTDIRKYLNNIIASVLSPDKIRDFNYIGDSDIEVKRIYSIESKDAMGELVTKYFEACRNRQWKDIEPGDFINKWVKAFGIGDRVSIELSADGYGILIRLFKNQEDTVGTLLVDEGCGVTKLIATLINIEYAILTAPQGDWHWNAYDRRPLTLAIEEPENHLHPKLQSLLAEMFVDAYNTYKIHFIVETHSEYLIRKLQTLVAKKDIGSKTVSLQYVYDAKVENRPKGEPHVKNIEIRKDGTLRDAFGPGFFDEADNLAMDLLTIKAMS